MAVPIQKQDETIVRGLIIKRIDHGEPAVFLSSNEQGLVRVRSMNLAAMEGCTLSLEGTLVNTDGKFEIYARKLSHINEI